MFILTIQTTCIRINRQIIKFLIWPSPSSGFIVSWTTIWKVGWHVDNFFLLCVFKKAHFVVKACSKYNFFGGINSDKICLVVLILLGRADIVRYGWYCVARAYILWVGLILLDGPVNSKPIYIYYVVLMQIF